MESINNIVSDYNSVSFSETQEVKLMNRIDRKYWFHISVVPEILQMAKAKYDILEIKLKNNKQRTIKERMESEGSRKNFTMEKTKFLSQKSPFVNTWLSPALENRFQRITLVHKEKTERCTLDFNLKFYNQSGMVTYKKYGCC